MTMTIKNKRLKISPGGIISLPVSARKALGMVPGVSAVAGISTGNSGVVLTGEVAKGSDQIRISKKGQAVLSGAAREYLDKGIQRHYWLELDDSRKVAILRAF
jgi:hypothetical protein